MGMRKIYRKIARQNGVTVEEVKRDMQSAINEAYSDPKNNHVIKAYQDKVPRKGEVPTVEEFIHYAANKAKVK